jgi:hypothetical protein
MLLAALGAPPPPQPVPRLGINIARPKDWSTELPFVDVFLVARPWTSQQRGGGKGPPLELDAQGWIRRLPPGVRAETTLCSIAGGHYPAGRYTVLYDGRGTLEFRGTAAVESRRPGRIALRVDPRAGKAFFLALTATDPADPVRNIRVLMPGHENDYRQNPWNPAFLRLWQGVACVRFMDMMETNGSPLVAWADRPTPDSGAGTFFRKGVAVELLVDLANRLHADPWFCMPHQADDDFVRNFAQTVKEQLDPDLKAYVEYSNEIWNGVFPQHRYAVEQGRGLNLGVNEGEASARYTARRSLEIFAIWENVFGGRDHLVRVLASQAANARLSEQIVSFEAASAHADALAIAPYLTMNVVPTEKLAKVVNPENRLDAAEIGHWPAAKVLRYLEERVLPRSVKWIREQKAVADRNGLALVAYEGGQHMVGARGAENNEALTQVLFAANADPKIATVYAKYLDAWRREGGGLFCHYSSVGEWSKWGSWSLLQYLDDDPARSPKYQAVMRWARSLGQTVGPAGDASGAAKAGRAAAPTVRGKR